MNVSVKEFIKFIAENWESEEEYAGRMETWCFYCKEYQEPRKPASHKEDCLHVKAVEFLKSLEVIETIRTEDSDIEF